MTGKRRKQMPNVTRKNSVKSMRKDKDGTEKGQNEIEK